MFLLENKISLESVYSIRIIKKSKHKSEAIQPLEIRKSNSNGYDWLICVTDGINSGWWGPLQKPLAELSVSYFDNLKDKSQASISTWIDRLRLSSRHSHTGLGAIAIGAIELALWDMVGKIKEVPVWALFTSKPFFSKGIPVYASCLGADLQLKNILEVAKELKKQGWLIQKWDKASDIDGIDWVDALIEVIDPETCAVDFRPYWGYQKNKIMLKNLPSDIAFIEEPVPPWLNGSIDKKDIFNLLAAGEHIYGPHELEQINMYDIWQPDGLFLGGFMNLLKVCREASRKGVRCMPHGGCFIPAIHAAVVLGTIEMVEWHLRLEPYRQAHFAEFTCPRSDNLVPLPDKPGWGMIY